MLLLLLLPSSAFFLFSFYILFISLFERLKGRHEKLGCHDFLECTDIHFIQSYKGSLKLCCVCVHECAFVRVRA